MHDKHRLLECLEFVKEVGERDLGRHHIVHEDALGQLTQKCIVDADEEVRSGPEEVGESFKA